MAEYLCPSCQRTMRIEGVGGGGTFACPHCGKHFRALDDPANPPPKPALGPPLAPSIPPPPRPTMPPMIQTAGAAGHSLSPAPTSQQVNVSTPVHVNLHHHHYGEKKSVVLALLLTFLFGPLGMLYSTVPGALVMLAVWVCIITPLSFVIVGLFLIPVAWIVQLAWAAMACDE